MLTSSSSVRVRRARVADAKALAEVFRQSWVQAYRGIIPHTHLQNLIRRRGTAWWRSATRSGDDILVLEAGGKIAGYATLGPCRRRGLQQGEIFEIYLTPKYQGLGFGEHLFEACRNRLDQRLLRGLLVWALAENTGAIDFYWRRGGRPVARTTERIGSTSLEKIGFAWD